MTKKPWWSWGNDTELPKHHMNISKFTKSPHEACKWMREQDCAQLKLMYRGELLCTVLLPDEED